MNKLFTIFVFTFSFFFLVPFSQSQIEWEKFQNAYIEGDTLEMVSIINYWSKTRSLQDEGDFQLCTFYYHVTKAANTKEKSIEENSLEIELVEQSELAKREKAALSQFKNKHLLIAEEALTKGIQYDPNRLDLIFALIKFNLDNQNWSKYSETTIYCIQQSKKNSNQWNWNNNTKYKDGEKGLLAAIDEFQSDLFAIGDDSLLSYMRMIAEELNKVYPNHLQAYFDMSIAHIINKDFDKAMKILQVAEIKFPKDQILLGNMAYCLKMKGDKKEATEYYKKVIKHGDFDHADAAKKRIEELQTEK